MIEIEVVKNGVSCQLEPGEEIPKAIHVLRLLKPGICFDLNLFQGVKITNLAGQDLTTLVNLSTILDIVNIVYLKCTHTLDELKRISALNIGVHLKVGYCNHMDSNQILTFSNPNITYISNAVFRNWNITSQVRIISGNPSGFQLQPIITARDATHMLVIVDFKGNSADMRTILSYLLTLKFTEVRFRNAQNITTSIDPLLISPTLRYLNLDSVKRWTFSKNILMSNESLEQISGIHEDKIFIDEICSRNRFFKRFYR